MKYLNKNKLIFILIFSCIFLIDTQKTFAQTNNTFSLSIEPAYQEVEIPENSESVRTTLTIKNPSDTSQQVELFAFDFKQSDHFGSIALLDGFTGQYPHTLASFLSFEKDSIIIEPHSEEKVTINIQNRTTLSPGGHYAAIVIRSLDEQTTQQQKILPAISSLLLVRKSGGERINLSLKELSWQPKMIATSIPEKINLTFENGGNTHIIPRGQVKITDLFNRVVFQGIVNDSSLYILPGTLRIIPVALKESLWTFPVMLLSLQVSGNSNIGEAVFSSEQSFLYVDWKVTLLILMLCGFILFKIIKKKQNHAKK